MSKISKYGLSIWQNRLSLLLLITLMGSYAMGQEIDIFYEDQPVNSFSHFSEIPDHSWKPAQSPLLLSPHQTDWIKLVIRSQEEESGDYLLKLGSGANMTIWSSVDSFQSPLKSGPLFRATEVNVSTGNSWDNKITIELTEAPTILYLHLERVYENKIVIQPELTPLIKFLTQQRQRERFLWLFYGLMLFLLIYQIFFFLLLRDITYLVHAGFVGCLVGFLAYHEGTTYQFLFTEWPVFNYHLNFLLGLIPLTYGLFFRSYLKLYKLSKKLDRWFRRSVRLHALFIPIPMILFWVTGSTAGVYTMVHVVNLIFISLYVWIFSKALSIRERQHQILMAGLMTFAFTGILITGSYLAGAGLDWKIALECGVLIEGLIFSFALTYRTRVWEHEKLASSHALVEQLRKNEELQNSFNQTLRKEVRTRTLQLKEALDKAEAGSKAKSEFLSAISHELRTPLNGIVGMTNLLREGKESQQEDLLQSLEVSSQDLLRLVDNVLDYTALEADHVRLNPEEFSINELLGELSSCFSKEASERNIQFIEKPVESGLLIRTDRDRLRQILINLLHNAFKFTTSGEIRLETTIQEEAGINQAQITFEISDTGIGMTEEEIALATMPFEQTQKGMQRGLQGVGIGLAIVRKLVNLMEGGLVITSEKGQGTKVVVRFSFPFTEVADSSLVIDGSDVTTSILEGKSVLLVEDHLVNQKVAKKYLSKWGMKVEVAENGRVALDKVKQSSFELILMDLHMPVMDGFTAVTEIKALGFPYTEIPIIALSAATHLAEVQQQVLDSGMLGFVTKPIKPNILKQRLEACFLSSPS